MGDAAQKLEGKPTALEMFKAYDHFCKAMLDAYCVLDMTGKVVKSNPLFSQLVGFKSRQILKMQSLDEMLQLDIDGDELKVANILDHQTPTRIDEVSGKSNDKHDLNLIIGVYPFIAEGEQVGAFVLIRDVTAETNLQDKYKDKATQSITDALTGLFNRKYFVEYLTNQVNTMQNVPDHSSQKIMSLIMLDIDHFKKVNDVYGHQAGDYVIATVAQLMKETFRKTDIVSRYGGEEFLAILPGTDKLGSMVAAEKLRKKIEDHNFVFDNVEMPIRISSGVAQIDANNEIGEDTIARADAALYHSKENGRNQVSLHDGTGIQSYESALANLGSGTEPEDQSA